MPLRSSCRFDRKLFYNETGDSAMEIWCSYMQKRYSTQGKPLWHQHIIKSMLLWRISCVLKSMLDPHEFSRSVRDSTEADTENAPNPSSAELCIITPYHPSFQADVLRRIRAQDIGVTSIENSHCRASEQLSARSTKFDLYHRKVSIC